MTFNGNPGKVSNRNLAEIQATGLKTVKIEGVSFQGRVFAFTVIFRGASKRSSRFQL